MEPADDDMISADMLFSVEEIADILQIPLSPETNAPTQPELQKNGKIARRSGRARQAKQVLDWPPKCPTGKCTTQGCVCAPKASVATRGYRDILLKVHGINAPGIPAAKAQSESPVSVYAAPKTAKRSRSGKKKPKAPSPATIPQFFGAKKINFDSFLKAPTKPKFDPNVDLFCYETLLLPVKMPILAKPVKRKHVRTRPITPVQTRAVIEKRKKLANVAKDAKVEMHAFHTLFCEESLENGKGW